MSRGRPDLRAAIVAANLALWAWGSAQGRRVPIVLLRLGALAYASWGLGNLFEDVIGWTWGEHLFVLGGMASVLVLVAAGIVILLTNSPWRWSGLVSFGLAAALVLDDLLIAAIAWGDIADLTNRAVTMGSGTLYGSIKRMLDQELIEETDERPDPVLDDQRRRYYRLTELGHRVGAAEQRRLVSLIDAARSRRLGLAFGAGS